MVSSKAFASARCPTWFRRGGSLYARRAGASAVIPRRVSTQCFGRADEGESGHRKDINYSHPEFNTEDELWTPPEGWATAATRYHLNMSVTSFLKHFNIQDEKKSVNLLTEELPRKVVNIKEVYAILFGVNDANNAEGIYSLRAVGEDELAQETILVFELEEDALRFAGLVEATMEHAPNVCSISQTDIIDFCKEQGYNCRMELAGSLFMPPDMNVRDTDWERATRLRSGRYDVMEMDPLMGTSATLSPCVASSDVQHYPHHGHRLHELTEDEIVLRQRLEKLLHPDHLN